MDCSCTDVPAMKTWQAGDSLAVGQPFSGWAGEECHRDFCTLLIFKTNKQKKRVAETSKSKTVPPSYAWEGHCGGVPCTSDTNSALQLQ